MDKLLSSSPLRSLIGAIALIGLASCGDPSNESAIDDDSTPANAGSSATEAEFPSQGSSGASGIGKTLFLQCAACHAVERDAAAKIGPNLQCIIDSVAGSQEGFNYSGAFQNAKAAGLRWDRETLAAFIADPKSVVPNNAMSFGGVADETKRAAIIDYLESTCLADGAGQ